MYEKMVFVECNNCHYKTEVAIFAIVCPYCAKKYEDQGVNLQELQNKQEKEYKTAVILAFIIGIIMTVTVLFLF